MISLVLAVVCDNVTVVAAVELFVAQVPSMDRTANACVGRNRSAKRAAMIVFNRTAMLPH
jgi:hypothetical protein